MRSAEARRAVAAAMSTATSLGLAAHDAVVLNDSNRLVVRLTPCDVVARVTPLDHHAGHHASARREVELVRQLARTDSPVALLEPRIEPGIVVSDRFEVTMWSHYEPVPRMLPPDRYAQALQRLHDGLRRIDVAAPHFSDRVAAVQRDVASRDVTPDLSETDRALLADMLRDLRRSIARRRAPEQLLHGEPHPGNVLDTGDGPLFIDFENAARGPVEYDLAWVPDDVSQRYAPADLALVDDCRGLVLAMIAAYRWRRDDEHPSGRESGVAFLNALRDGPPWPACDDVTW